MRAWRGCLVKEKILEVVDLCKEYPVKRGALLPKEIGMVHAVNHVSFTLYQGETLGIIGESGCGKSMPPLHQRASGSNSQHKREKRKAVYNPWSGSKDESTGTVLSVLQPLQLCTGGMP